VYTIAKRKQAPFPRINPEGASKLASVLFLLAKKPGKSKKGGGKAL